MSYSSILCCPKKTTSNLSTLAEFLIKVYFPGWFQIKFNSKITDGPKNYINILIQMGFPNKIIQDIAVAVLQRNAYFAHHGNTGCPKIMYTLFESL